MPGWRISGGRAPADFLLSAGGFFLRGFFGAFCDQKIHQIHHFHGGLLEDFPP